MTDAALRQVLREDIASAERSFRAADWKGCTVLSGSVVETLLLWALQEHENENPGVATAAGQELLGATADLNWWNLNQLGTVARHLKVISDETFKLCDLAREFRNFIHPGRAARLARACDRGTALSALAAVEHVARDLA